VPKKGEGLDRETIVTTALELLDEVGLDGLTLRRLAQELGVQAPALYWHVRNKQELLDLMASRLSLENDIEFSLAAGQTWQELFVRYAYAHRRGLLSHRDGARLVAGTRPLETLLPRLEQALSPLVKAGFTPGQAMRALMTLNLFIGGFVLEEQAEQARWAEAGTAESEEGAFHALVARLDVPTVVQAFEEAGDPNGEDAFRDAVGYIVDGLAQVLARNRSPAR
jgi:TetR/AcrR family transcriptional regulator, tetracycline repressor protein